ncbi:hypothetical protein JHK85_039858 [Glycine max]|nr:hypothetical protein JHK85_039858 [Glycine max]KAH1093562.1 hypothetical protein GYH30_039342 [Glycine max]
MKKEIISTKKVRKIFWSKGTLLGSQNFGNFSPDTDKRKEIQQFPMMKKSNPYRKFGNGSDIKSRTYFID